MSKILLFVESTKNELNLIKILRELTAKSLSELKSSIVNKKPILEAILEGPQRNENVARIKKLLYHAKKNGDIIKIFQVSNEKNYDTNIGMFEITEEIFDNKLARRKAISRSLDRLEDSSKDNA